MVHEYFAILLLIPIYMMWFTKEENIEEYTNVLGLSFFYLIPLIRVHIKKNIITFPIDFFRISTIIFFPSFIATEFGSLKMWLLVQIGIYNLLFFIFNGKPSHASLQEVEKLQPVVFFIRKFKFVFEFRSSCFPKQIAKFKLGNQKFLL